MNLVKLIGAAMVLSLAVGCVDNDVTIEVLRARPNGDGACEASLGAEGEARGLLDVSYTAADYVQVFQVRNNGWELEDESAYRLDTNDYIVERAVVSYGGLDPTSDTLLASLGERDTPMAVTIETGADAGIFVNLIPNDVATVMRDQLAPTAGEFLTILTRFRLEGRTLDGWRLESTEFTFPGVICNSCLGCGVGATTIFHCGPGQLPYTCEEPAGP